MKHNIIAAVIIAVGLVVAGFLYGGRYYFVRLDQCTVARGDRFTGELQFIPTLEGKDCKFNF